jgi:hypothetical protein
MSEDYEVEFGPVRITCSGERVTLDGYAFRGTIVPGQRFTLLSESLMSRAPQGYGPSSRKPVGVIDLTVESIFAYGRLIEELSCGVSGRLELTAIGGAQIRPRMVLSGRSSDTSHNTADGLGLKGG